MGDLRRDKIVGEKRKEKKERAKKKIERKKECKYKNEGKMTNT